MEAAEGAAATGVVLAVATGVVAMVVGTEVARSAEVAVKTVDWNALPW